MDKQKHFLVNCVFQFKHCTGPNEYVEIEAAFSQATQASRGVR